MLPLLTLAGASAALQVAAAPDPTCVSYLTVGDSNCNPQPVQPARTPPPSGSFQNSPPIQVQNEVDKYLENYGKPPREFVEFYLNPTAENASKWVRTYQQMMQKGQDLSKAWSEAEQLYTNNGQPSVGAAQAQLIEPQAVRAAPVAQIQPAPVSVAPPASPPARFGAFAGAVPGGAQSAQGVRPQGASLTYFFSQTCPYCARMTPELAVLAGEMSNKLTLTCVDVTPLSATAKPDAAYITSKLPCKWRLPEAGEVEREQVSQTPTLVIQKEGQPPVRLSGYVPLAQLRSYF